jgi:NADPH-dependent 2,4-dienoyl-CoA reductase/sulfur reductase-like enzyme
MESCRIALDCAINAAAAATRLGLGPMSQIIPETWDAEADVVAVGSGGGGLASAIAAHDHGASALILERSEQIGGVTAMSRPCATRQSTGRSRSSISKIASD